MPATSSRTRKATTAPATPADTEPTTTATDPAPADTEPATATDPAPATATDPAPATDTRADAPVSGVPVSGAPVSGVPVSGAPAGSGDHLKVVMVAGILGDHPDGVTASGIVDESGLRATIVGRVLAAMETAGAAVRKPATTDDGEPDPA